MSRFYRPRSSTGAVKTPNKSVIYWDESRHKYIVKPAYAASFKNQFNSVCHTAVYLGTTEGAYTIEESDLNAAKIVLEAVFGDGMYEFIPKPQFNHAMVNGEVDGAAKAALKLFTTAGPAASAKAFKSLANQFHPDLNPDADPTKMTDINTAWAELKKELGWS